MLFGSSPSCPVEPDVQAWVEQRMQWLIAQFGWENFVNLEMLLPIEEHFPTPCDQSAESIRELFDQVCTYMDIDSTKVNLQFYTGRRAALGMTGIEARADRRATGISEVPDKPTVWLETSILNDLTSLVASMAHELCYMQLLAGRRVSANEADVDSLADLATIYFGFGLFAANASLREQGSYVLGGTSFTRTGCLTDPVLAYALALYAWTRDELPPPWEGYLRGDIRSLFRPALAYLKEMDEEILVPLRPGETVSAGPYLPELAEKLAWNRLADDRIRCDEADAVEEVELLPDDEAEILEVNEAEILEADEAEIVALPADEAGMSATSDAFTQAVFLMQSEEWEQAIGLLSTVLQEDPYDGDAYQQRAAAYMALGKFEKCLDDAEMAVDLLPEDSESYRIRGEAFLKLKQYEQAIEDFTHCLDEEDYPSARHERVARLYYLRGVARGRSGQWPQAVTDLSRVIQEQRDWGAAYQARAEVYECLGETEKARADREEADRRGAGAQ